MGIVLKAAFLAAVAGVFAGSVALLRGGASEVEGEIRVISRLDEYTRSSHPNVANTIPTFLMQAGRTGILPAPEPAPGDPAATADTPAAGSTPTARAGPDAPAPTPGGPATTPTDAGAAPVVTEPAPDAPIPVSAVRPLNEAELQKGFCTATLPRLVRQQYPGAYDDIPDAELEKSVLKQHPEYKGRLCVLPVWIDADPRDIVKYEVSQDIAAIPQRVWVYAGLIAAGFAALVLVAYKKATG